MLSYSLLVNPKCANSVAMPSFDYAEFGPGILGVNIFS